MRALAMIGTAVLFAVAPASIGLIGNASLSQDVPVRLPATATLLDSNGREMPSSTPGGDKGAGHRRDGRAREVTEGVAESPSGSAREGDDRERGGPGGHRGRGDTAGSGSGAADN